jgi:hypothetical protein
MLYEDIGGGNVMGKLYCIGRRGWNCDGIFFGVVRWK